MKAGINTLYTAVLIVLSGVVMVMCCYDNGVVMVMCSHYNGVIIVMCCHGVVMTT